MSDSVEHIQIAFKFAVPDGRSTGHLFWLPSHAHVNRPDGTAIHSIGMS